MSRWDMKFKKSFLQDAIEDAVSDTVIGKSRWCDTHRMVFEHGGKLYMVHYNVGSTELQDESPFENAPDDIECVEVEAYERTVTDYRKVSR